MSPAKFERIISVSSEDPAFPAENLLKNAYNDKKWKCRNAGEKQISVVIQLTKAEKITAVDVGNYGAAFVEILVAKSSNPDDYKVLVVASSLMTLQEAKMGTNLTSVRFFKGDNIATDVAFEKWDRIKVVCSQPYNKLIQYGLSFLVVHGTSPLSTEKESSVLGHFQLKKKEIANPIPIGSLFAKRNEVMNAEPKGAAAIRVASTTGLIKKNVSPKLPAKPKPLEESEDSTSRKNSREKKDSQLSQNKKRNTPNDSSPLANGRIRNGSKNVPKNSSSKKNQPRRLEKPFNRLFEGVIFAISGFQNPQRSDLRSKAIQMGAKYKPDWDNTCTHLLCAFPNTPKFNQVLGLGKIITKEWIETCHQRRMKLPWRRYALHPPDKNEPESDEEIYEYVERPPSPVDNRRRISPGNSSEDSGPDTEEEVEKILARQKADKNGAVTQKYDEKKESTKDQRTTNVEKKSETNTPRNKEKLSNFGKKNLNSTVNIKKGKPNKNCVINSSSDDGDSEMMVGSVNTKRVIKKEVGIANNKIQVPDNRSIRTPAKKKQKLLEEDSPDSIYEMDTETEDEAADSKKFNLPHLPAFFEGLAFHTCNDISEEEYYEVRRYILAHKGYLVEEDDISYKEVNYIIGLTSDEIKKIKDIHPKAVAVKPDWIWKAHDEGRIPPTPAFEVND